MILLAQSDWWYLRDRHIGIRVATLGYNFMVDANPALCSDKHGLQTMRAARNSFSLIRAAHEFPVCASRTTSLSITASNQS